MTDTYHAALTELHIAQQQFEWADPEYIDVAIYRLQAAELAGPIRVYRMGEVEQDERKETSWKSGAESHLSTRLRRRNANDS